jgi:hypothetical protein
MPKYAELPDGKIMTFADGISDKEMQRQVRRELGRDGDPITKTLSAMAGAQLTSLLDGQNKKQQSALEGVAEIMVKNSNRIASELSNAIKEISKSQDKLAAELQKAMNSQSSALAKLQVNIDDLNRTLDAALGQSLEALDRSVASASSVAGESGVVNGKLSAMITELAEAVRTLHAMRTQRKRAFRNRDGSWTMEPIGRG